MSAHGHANGASAPDAPQEERKEAQSAPSRAPSFDKTNLIPAKSIAGRALVVVIAIMTTLASLAAVSALLVHEAALAWRGDIAHEITVQILPEPGHDVELEAAQVAKILTNTAGISHVRAFTKAETEDLLTPWLGKDGAGALSIADLPLPRLVVARIDALERMDLDAVRGALHAGVPTASLDDHRLWLERLAAMADGLVAIALVIFLLVCTAMALVIGFVTRGAMADNREIIEVLHFVGASDAYIASAFQRHFMRLGFEGAALGGLAALSALFLLGMLTRLLRASAGGAQLAAFFGTFEIGASGYGAIVALMALVSFATGHISRAIVYRHLQAMG